jgi:hypothetical protein
MRNLNDHPITTDEKLAALAVAIELLETSNTPGDMRPVALRSLAEEIVERAPEEVAARIVKELDWHLGNWWYAKTIIGNYEFKNWNVDPSGPAWLSMPGERNQKACRNIDEARKVAQRHFNAAILSVLA